MRRSLALTGVVAAAFLAAGPALPAVDQGARAAWPRGSAIVSYASEPALERALARHPATVVRRLRALRVVEVRPAGEIERYATRLSAEPGIVGVERALPRRSLVEPALVPAPTGAPLQWQFAAVRADQVPPEIALAAAGVTIAVIDTGADLRAPDLAAKSPLTHSVRVRSADVTDLNGHGTFVAALAAGSGSNNDGIAGIAGEAKLMIVQAGGPGGAFTDIEEAAAIVWAVDHGARIVNLSLGGPSTSTTERRAIDYAVSRGVLLVAAVGNSYQAGNPIEYPAALLQPAGSRGVGGRGLAVAASTRSGVRAPFSSTGTHVSLAAPGEAVFSALSASSPASRYPRVPLPGSAGGVYGYGSGTSFAAPQVSGAAALVWAANPQLRAEEVASILEQTASGQSSWNAELGYGVLDVAAAIARAQDPAHALPFRVEGRRAGSRISLSWPQLPGAVSFRVSVTRDSEPPSVLTPATVETSASYSLAPGSLYTFTVTALGAAGEELAASAPWALSLRQAAARISLTASLPRGSESRRVVLDARLSVDGLPGAEGARTVVLESFDGRHWARAATAVTDSSGRAGWRYALTAGAYRIRARYLGTDEIAPAVSAPVELTIR
jgi:subtilisin family serine protease